MMNRSTGLFAAVIALFACAGPVPEGLGVHDGQLAACPTSPNCVSSGAEDSQHAIRPIEFPGDPSDAWRAARAAVTALPRTKIVYEANGYLHAESRSALFRFVDDFELQLRAEERTIAVRSASRVGFSDMGVNRDRVERLRSLFDVPQP
jgi:uncharacterized protein (DUF1499 family)